MDHFIQKHVEKRKRLLDAFTSLSPAVCTAAERVASCLKDGHRVYVFGNGGSASQAAHFAGELVNRYYLDRPGLPAVSLTTDGAGITAIANDTAFRNVFSRQVEALGTPGDTALGISTSGRSPNVLAALSTARERGLFTLALCGDHRDALEKAGVEMILSVPDPDTPAVQEIHLFILHLLAERIEAILYS